jgi:hypothetical protein
VTNLEKEWITAAEAVQLLKPAYGFGLATNTICTRAHNGLIRARAERYVVDHAGSKKAGTNVDIPAEFWWAKGGAALNQNWTAGDFDTWLGRNSINQVHLSAFGGSFLRADIERLVPATPNASKESKPKPAGTKIFIGHGRSPTGGRSKSKSRRLGFGR